ncbi:hypothetical protein O181_003643 [Austropuccinia psidii MF-1]|uniref:Uncharacterized protein n=1 Tax=Austropuccinia psidii MF-1 TaxID=1389203 RepID=A0A9Q3GDR8_9BASI|nr:hypothetical protein [Austropuccinia psidii MF-1]
MCPTTNSVHFQEWNQVEFVKDTPLDCLGPLRNDPDGFWNILTPRDNVSTFTFNFPLQARLEAPATLQSCISLIYAQLGLYLTALHMENARNVFLKASLMQ